jgi:hypothetical protein
VNYLLKLNKPRYPGRKPGEIMGPYNPYRNYDKGMDDAYIGKEPQSQGRQYMEGYEHALELEQMEQQAEEQKQFQPQPDH